MTNELWAVLLGDLYPRVEPRGTQVLPTLAPLFFQLTTMSVALLFVNAFLLPIVFLSSLHISVVVEKKKLKPEQD